MHCDTNISGCFCKALFYPIWFSIVFFFSCSGQSKETYIYDLKSYIETVSADCKNYTEEDWVKSDTAVSEFMQIKEKKFNSEFTEEERSEVNQLIGKYSALRIKHEVGKIKGEFNDVIDQAKGAIKELSKDTL